MSELNQFFGLLLTHFMGDFVLQSHWMASNKSKRLDALALHIVTYTALLAFAAAIIFGLSVATISFVFVNGVLHFAVDGFTSRVTSRLWQQQRWHDFFVVVGMDQLMHQATLAGTMVLIFP